MTATIRLAGVADAAAIAAVYAPIVLGTPISFEVAPPSAEEMAERIAGTLPRLPWLVAERAGEVVGYAYGSPHRARAAYGWSVEVSAYVAEEARSGGVGRGMYTALLDLLTAQGHENAYAGITLPNAASVGFHEAMGFGQVGVFRRVGWKGGAWHDVGWWQRPLGGASPPRPPVTLAALGGTAVEDALAAGRRALRA